MRHQESSQANLALFCAFGVGFDGRCLAVDDGSVGVEVSQGQKVDQGSNPVSLQTNVVRLYFYVADEETK